MVKRKESKNRYGLTALILVFVLILAGCGDMKKTAEPVSNSGSSANVNESTVDDEDNTNSDVRNHDDNANNAEEAFDWNTLPIANEADFQWEELFDGSGVMITGYSGSETAFKVPGSLGGKEVAVIARGTFEEQEELTAIDLTDTSLTEIQQQAFYQCLGLKRVALPDMPAHSMDTNPFLHCSRLAEITLGEGSELTMENGMIYDDTKLIMRVPAFSDQDAVIREDTTEIGHGAFMSSNIVSAVMPDSVVSVDRLTFEECASLKNVTLSQNLKSISQSMFEGCGSLKEIAIPEGVKEIHHSAFMWCDSLENVSLPSTLTEIGEYGFCRCEALTNISIPAGVTSIGKNAFASCNALKDVYYGGSESDWHQALGADVFKSVDNDSGVVDVSVHYDH